LVEADYAGVDILCNQHGRPFVLEVNSIPGWRGLQHTVELDIADTIAEYVLGLVS